MKGLIRFPFQVLLIVILTGCAAPKQILPTPTATLTSPTASSTEPPRRLIMGTLTSQALANNLIGDPETRSFYVYLPTDYFTSSGRYPVLYAIGVVYENFSIESFVEIIQDAVDRMESKGWRQDFIIVFPDTANRFGISSGMIYSSPTVGDYETYFAKEVVAEVDTTYRTLPRPESRGLTGCSNGGTSTIHLALKRPDVFGVAAPMSAWYDWVNDSDLPMSKDNFIFEPSTWEDYYLLNAITQGTIAMAAVASPNPNKPPFYLDMPFQIVKGKPEVVEEVYEKILALDPVHDVQRYLEQSLRIQSLMIYHGDQDFNRIGPVRDFEKMLTRVGIQHEYIEVQGGGHCNLDWSVVLNFMSEKLVK